MCIRDRGKYKGSTGCMYIKRLSDVDTSVLRKLIAASVAELSLIHISEPTRPY